MESASVSPEPSRYDIIRTETPVLEDIEGCTGQMEDPGPGPCVPELEDHLLNHCKSECFGIEFHDGLEVIQPELNVIQVVEC